MVTECKRGNIHRITLSKLGELSHFAVTIFNYFLSNETAYSSGFFVVKMSFLYDRHKKR